MSSRGIDNSAFGDGALADCTNCNLNTAVGVNALLSNNADDNTAVGVDALESNTSGVNNTVTGEGALESNTTGHTNTARELMP